MRAGEHTSRFRSDKARATLMALAIASLAAHRHPIPDRVDPPSGAALYVLMPDSSESIHDAIDHVVSHMSFIIRGIARGRLTKVNPTPQRVRVDVEANSVSVAFDNGNPVVTPLNGDTVAWRNPLTGETNHARGVEAGDTVRQVIAAKDGERENALIFLEDGQRLRLHVTVTSHRLPRPLTYDLLFRKDSL